MGPITKVTVEDYQSIGLAELELGKLTVIVGKGNMGKSALLRAISACVFNETGSGMIRIGQKKTSVRLDFAGDQSVTWVKDDKSARYNVDVAGTPVTFTKLAGGVPDELQDVFGIKTIEIDSTFSIRPQIHGQFDSPLLLTESSGKAARALAKLTKLDSVLRAQMTARTDLRRVKADATARKREVEELTARMKTFPDMDQLDTRLERARHSVEIADNRLNALGKVEDAYILMMDAKERLAVEPPTVTELDKLDDRLVEILNAMVMHRVLLETVEAEDAAHLAYEAAVAAAIVAEATYDGFIKDLEICPVCGQPINAEHHD